MKQLLKQILQELILIRKELQAINSKEFKVESSIEIDGKEIAKQVIPHRGSID